MKVFSSPSFTLIISSYRPFLKAAKASTFIFAAIPAFSQSRMRRLSSFPAIERKSISSTSSNEPAAKESRVFDRYTVCTPFASSYFLKIISCAIASWATTTINNVTTTFFISIILIFIQDIKSLVHTLREFCQRHLSKIPCLLYFLLRILSMLILQLLIVE